MKPSPLQLPPNCDAKSFAIAVVQTLQEAGHAAVFAGGCVRDMLLAKATQSDPDDADPDDYDVATDATPGRVRELFGKRQTLAVGESFGVIIVVGPKREGRHLQVEVATFRAEGEYSDGRRPDTVVFCTAEEDAARRDFTINGMFYDPIADTVLDYVGGQSDLEKGVVRAIGNAHDRIAEDKLRMLRAVRFTARFRFDLDPKTRAAVEKHADEIVVVSWERITQELTKVVLGPSRRRGIELMADTGLLQYVLPEVEQLDRVLPVLEAFNRVGPDPLPFPVGLVALLPFAPAGSFRNPTDRSISAICLRLKLSNDDRKAAIWLAEHRRRLANFQSLDLADRKTLLANPLAEALIALVEAEADSNSACSDDTDVADNVDTAKKFLASTPAEILDPEPMVTGDDLKSLGLTPGRQFKEILEAVRRQQLKEELSNKQQALEWIRSFIA